jgi:hypothetical protein
MILAERDALQALAAGRREVSRSDPAADALEYAADRMADLHRAIESQTAYLSPDDYAALHGVQAATVRKWIRTGQLQAMRTQRGGWAILVTAIRVKAPRRLT